MDPIQNTKKKWMRRVTTLILICILIFLGIKNVDTVSSIALWCLNLAFPLVVGVAIALIIDVPMRLFENHLWKNSKNKFLCAIRRPVSFIVSLIIILGCLVGIVWVIIPELIESIKIIVMGVIDMVKKIDVMTQEELAESPFGSIITSIDWDKVVVNLQNWLKDKSSMILKGAFSTLSSVVVAIFDAIVAFAFAIYLLFSKDKIKKQLIRLVRVWMPKDFGEWLIHACSVATNNFRSFIAGQTLEALILGALCMLGMLIFNIPYAPMVSILVGITALIPVVGGFIGGGIGAFMILTVDPSKALFFIIFLVILQQLEGNLIYPKVMGKRVNLPGIWILASVTVGGGIGGPLGMLLSVPITSTAYVLIKEATHNREMKNAAETISSSDSASGAEVAPIEDLLNTVSETIKEMNDEPQVESSKTQDLQKTKSKKKKNDTAKKKK